MANMLKLTRIACVAALLAACAGNSGEYVLTGKLQNCNSTYGVIKTTPSFSDETKWDTVQIAADGTFRYVRSFDEPLFSFMVVGEQGFFQLFLINGTANTLEADLSVPGNSRMGGDLENAYAFQKKQQAALERISDAVYTSFEEMQQAISALRDSAEKELAMIPNETFCRLSRQERESMLLLYRTTYYDRLRDRNLPANADADYNRYMLEDCDVATSENLANGLLSYYLSWCGLYREANGKNDPFQYQMDVACEKIKDVTLRTKAILSILGDFFGGEDKYGEAEAVYAKANGLLSDSTQRAWLTEKYTTFRKLRPGAPAIDCEWSDAEGKISRLSDLFGKVLYIDVWATWCGPCCAEIPYLEKLAEHYKNDARLDIVSVSVDANRKAWENKLAKDKPRWKQFLQGDFTTLYNINGIPRFILLDKSGKIITVDAPRPSDPKIISWLDEKLK